MEGADFLGELRKDRAWDGTEERVICGERAGSRAHMTKAAKAARQAGWGGEELSFSLVPWGWGRDGVGGGRGDSGAWAAPVNYTEGPR